MTFKEAVFGAKNWRATWISFGMAVMNQFSAIGPVCIFASILIKDIEKKTEDFPINVNSGVLLIGVVAIVSALGGALPLHYFGRRPILIVSHGSLAVTHAIIGILYHYEQYVTMYIFIQFFVFWFYAGTGNVSFIYCGEVCLDQAMGVVLAGLWMTEIILSFLISYMIDSPLGVTFTFVVYAALNFIAFIYCICLKETRGLTAAQLDVLYLPKQKKISSSEI